jgi:hypothetical protein
MLNNMFNTFCAQQLYCSTKFILKNLFANHTSWLTSWNIWCWCVTVRTLCTLCTPCTLCTLCTLPGTFVDVLALRSRYTPQHFTVCQPCYFDLFEATAVWVTVSTDRCQRSEVTPFSGCLCSKPVISNSHSNHMFSTDPIDYNFAYTICAATFF